MGYFNAVEVGRNDVMRVRTMPLISRRMNIGSCFVYLSGRW